MATATLTTRGRITIPMQTRRAMNLGPGDTVEFIQTAEGRYQVVASKAVHAKDPPA